MDDEYNKKELIDHDLLIELRTEMRGVRADIKEIKDDTAKRVSALEDLKESKIEVARLWDEGTKIHIDHEKRIRINEETITKIMTYGSAFLILLTVLQLVLKYYSK